MDAWKGGGGGARRSKEEQNKIIIWRVRDWLIVFCFCFFLVLVYDR